MTKEEWIERQLAKAPEPTAEDIWWVLNRFGFPQEQVEAAYEAMLREKKEREQAEQRGSGHAGDALSASQGSRDRTTRPRSSRIPGRGADSHPSTT
ncbi:hypothetical protein ABZ338_18190 [Streptomyces albidoflavus]|uniref:hypothetical protein n=1 Tax=Streptomyces albidoflavus TaxID=1886 RepID=UPI0033CA5110